MWKSIKKRGINKTMKKLKRKLIQVGNSLGITLPKEYLRKLGFSKGDKVDIILLNEEKNER